MASIDTLRSWVNRGKLGSQDFDVVILDECHIGISKSRKMLLANWPNALLIGLTATPCRSDGKALGILFDHLIIGATVKELQASRRLVQFRYFQASNPDLSSVRRRMGEFEKEDLGHVMLRPELVGDVVENIAKHAAGRKGICFCVNVEHSISVAEEAIKAGIAAAHVDANTPLEQRNESMDALRKGRVRLLTNVNIASVGLDVPDVGFISMARPTLSLSLYIQQGGRGSRAADGKQDCILFDHAGNIRRHGFLEDDRQWTLNGEMALEEPPKRSAGEAKDAIIITCPECARMFSGARVCPECGFSFTPQGKIIICNDGDLEELNAAAKQAEQQRQRQEFYGMLRSIGAEKGYKAGWAANKYREKYHAFPPWAWNNTPMVAPSQAVRGWVQSRNIAWRKALLKNRLRA